MAVYPIAAGQPDMSGNYLPTMYAARLLVVFYLGTCLSQISNTDYEGQVSNQGEKVVIRILPAMDIKDHVAGQALEYQNPAPSTVELLLDKGKYWAFNVDDVMRRQSDIAYVDKWAADGAQRLTISIENGVFGDIYDDVHASNAGASAGVVSDLNLGVAGTPLSITAANIITAIVNCGTVLDEQSAPQEGRWMVLPPWVCGLIKQSDLKDASLAGDTTSVLRNGRLGMIDRFTIYMNNNLTRVSSDSATYCLFGHKSGLTFASQMVKQEELKNPNAFGDIVRGLQVYGYKVVKPEALGALYVAAG